MSPEQQERLRQIKAFCERIVEAGKARTQGKWGAGSETIWSKSERICGDLEEENRDFIALCAGPAEAAARSTIAAIDWVTRFSLVDLSPCNGGSCMVATEVDERLDQIRDCAINAILDAWKGVES